MAIDFSNLQTRLDKGQPLTQQDLMQVLDAQISDTFTLADLAAAVRQKRAGNSIEVADLIEMPGAQKQEVPAPDALIEMGAGQDKEQVAARLHELAQQGIERLEILPNLSIPQPPMDVLRLLAAARLALPQATLHLGANREASLRSLQPLALPIVDSILLATNPSSPGLVFEDLKLIVGSGREITGAVERDLVADYVVYLSIQGVKDAKDLARAALEEDQGGGCGGGCACGAGGCGS